MHLHTHSYVMVVSLYYDIGRQKHSGAPCVKGVMGRYIWMIHTYEFDTYE